ncbi:AraC family transcriptional regulator [uncultured Psychroserpens sp.]|uniref:helix-turn-helix domain-containing protein n=1 Tax=uncultured Psychroserpens sp. TaxID=255436 RepID=UPI002607B074|nr:AraC family transcriptional regulator [uncultured Psychroserpens sp.]
MINSFSIWISVFCLIAIVNALFLVFLFLKRKPFNPYGNIFISLLLIALALRISKSIFFYLFYDISPFYISIGLMGKLAIGPFLLFFTKSETKDGVIKLTNYLHLLPSLIAVCVGWQLTIEQLTFLFWSGTFMLTAYILCAWHLYRSHNKLKEKNASFVLSKTVLIGVTMIWMTFVIQLFSQTINMYLIGTIIAVIVLYVLNYRLTIFTVKKTRLNKTKHISVERIKGVIEAINFSFKEERIYRDPKLTLTKLSAHIDQPVYLISQAINKTYGKTFPEFVNYYRVEELKKELEEFGTTNYTIEGIAYSVGFNTPSAFYAAFKREIGITPQKFIEQNLNRIENKN